MQNINCFFECRWERNSHQCRILDNGEQFVHTEADADCISDVICANENINSHAHNYHKKNTKFFARPTQPAVLLSVPLSLCLDLPIAAVTIPVTKSMPIKTTSVARAESQPPSNVARNPYKMCPAYILPHWAEFKKKVESYLNSGSASSPSTEKQLYRVRKSWSDAKSQIGAFSSLENAKKACKVGCAVFDSSGKQVYPAKKSVDEVAREVIQGKWSNGAERKKRLNDAGYDYNEVQKKVNQLI